MIPLLVLRPEPGASATAARARALGLTAIVAPLFTIEAIAWTPPPPESFDALMLTSANAVRHAGPALSSYNAVPIYAVGEATAAAARASGFAEVHPADGDAADLAAMLAAAGISRALHLGGVERRDAAHPAVRIERIAVYRAVPVASLPSEIGKAIAVPRNPGRVPGSTVPQEQRAADAFPRKSRSEPDLTVKTSANSARAVAPLHSPRAAALFAALLDDASRAYVSIVAISGAAAAAAGPGWCAIATAPVPTDAALLAVAARLCEDGD